jgi:prepilin-type N-terminal cleavage/methylation domain-containing protein
MKRSSSELNKIMTSKANKNGFTLIEILIVVTIIALLSSVILVGLQPARTVARDTRRIMDLQQVKTGLELYFNKCGYYPGGPQPNLPCMPFMPIFTWQDLTAALTGSSLDIDRIPDDITVGVDYLYATDSAGRRYVLGATLEDPSNSALINSVHNNNLSFPIPFSCDPPVYCTHL